MSRTEHPSPFGLVFAAAGAVATGERIEHIRRAVLDDDRVANLVKTAVVRARLAGSGFRFATTTAVFSSTRTDIESPTLTSFLVADGTLSPPDTVASLAGRLVRDEGGRFRFDGVLGRWSNHVTALPTVFSTATVRDQEVLSRIGGPAAEWLDGFRVWAIRGVLVPRATAEGPVTRELVVAERNAEVRRALIEHLGVEELMKGARLVDEEDGVGRLWRLEETFEDGDGNVWRMTDGAGTIAYVEVVNSTAEPDGTFKTYWLRVPPETTTAREAVAWTFGMSAGEYAPEVET